MATHPVQCAAEEDYDTLEARRAIAYGWMLDDRDKTPPFAEEPYLLDADEMHRRFADTPGAVQNAMEIAKRCNFSFNFGKTHLPSLQLPNNDDSDTALALQAKAGLGEQLSGQYESRLAHELEVIQKMGFADYFLIVADFVNWAKKTRRSGGSRARLRRGFFGRLCAKHYDLGPIKHKLLFERFLNPARVSLPDFDIDFCVEGRDRVIEYVTKKYGADHVCQIVTFGTIGAKGAVRDCGRVLGLPYGKCDSLARMIPHGFGHDSKKSD